MNAIEQSQRFEEFFSHPILDGHIHVCANCSPELTWEALHLSGVQQCNALSLSRPDQPGTLNEFVLRFKRYSQGRAYGFGALDYTSYCQDGTIRSQELVEQAIHMRDMGLDGIKMWEMKPSVYIHLPGRLDGPVYADYFAWLEENNLPVLLHIADAPRFWDPQRVGLDPWSFAGPEYPTRQEMYAEMEGILFRHPKLRLILAHFAFFWDELPQAAQFLDAHPSVCLDLAPGVEGYVHLSKNPQTAHDFFTRYQTRIIYGTDTGAVPTLDASVPFIPQTEIGQPWLVRAMLETDWDIPFPTDIGVAKNAFAGQRLRGMALAKPVLEQIYGTNFRRLVGAAPHPV